jgi:Tfp pilus assembly protein PilX
MKRLEAPLRPALTGALDRSQRNCTVVPKTLQAWSRSQRLSACAEPPKLEQA